MSHLLVLDDDPDMCAFVVHAAVSAGYEATSSTDFEKFKAGLTPGTSVVVVDLMMPEVDGVQVLRYLGSRGCASEIILISGYDKKVLKVAEQLARALGLKIRASIQKPIALNRLQEVLTERGDVERQSPAGLAGADGLADRDALRRAITHDQLLVHYQPQFYIRTRKLAGWEALVRWQHPARGLLPAGAFIEAFEAAGLIDELTWVVVRKILADRRTRLPDAARTPVAMNLSALSLRDLSLPERLLTAVTDQGAASSDFIIEITQSGLVEELQSALDVLARMRLKGFRLSIDDFGTGYAMMKQLQRVPAEQLKIDIEFVQSMLSDESADVIVRKTLELAHDLEMQVVAEGVETAEQLSALCGYGCDVAQGYFLGRPGPIAAFPGI